MFEETRDNFLLTTDVTKMSVETIHAYLSRSYWAEGIPRALVEKSMRGSLCFGILEGEQQIAFARVISDYATFAYIADVFVLEAYRGRGLSKWLMACIKMHPDLQGLRRWSLATRDAHGLYKQFGFSELKDATRWMEIVNPGIYKR